ncbi:hypothetical protein THIAE_02865 [Thiomicrospira aerophila AL3]|uniref:Uncharacterized protein n=1 Tax=Thiomicrospira aerophila AL3 TaxID=717772 RepID=W0DV34_9GAMM|nr:DsrE family protein [Thiomicrospira aerophila]AHF00854.1 hypothetical protein THIAE_02865 [Thiomicrospira aerophila AL3]
MKNFVKALLVSFAGLLTLGNMPSYANSYDEQKVVYHVNYGDEQRYRGMLGNIQNHINGVGEDQITIHVVMHGAGIGLLNSAHTDELIQSRILNLKAQGVNFKICANTLQGNNIAVSELFDASEADIVPAGVAEIAALQQQGFVYLRP